MITLEDYIKDKNNKLTKAFFELYSQQIDDNKGKKIKDVARFIDTDIDSNYKLELSWAYKWSIIYKESGARCCEVQGLELYQLGELLMHFTECVIEDYDFELMNQI
jgi:hypothetical protein